eukprot:1375498-Rhodomonas_salina.1
MPRKALKMLRSAVQNAAKCRPKCLARSRSALSTMAHCVCHPARFALFRLHIRRLEAVGQDSVLGINGCIRRLGAVGRN